MYDILIADDEKLAREAIKFLLSECEGVGKVYEANNGKSALEIVQRYHPRIVMLDIEMPNINGIEVEKQLSDDISILFITAFSQFEKDMASIESADYLLKPFRDEEFFDCFEKACAKQHKLFGTSFFHWNFMVS